MKKERYELQEVFEDGSFYWCLKDNDTKLFKPLVNLHTSVDLLNRQDARIKELEKIRDKGNQKLENFYNEKIDKLDSDYNKHFNELIEENQQLKEKYDNLYKCYQKTSQEDLKDKYDLAEENQQLKQQLSDEEKAHDLCIDHFNEECEKLRKQIKFESEARERFKQENQQLKQSQNQKAIAVLEKIKCFYLYEGDCSLIDGCELEEFIDNQIKEFAGEK